MNKYFNKYLKKPIEKYKTEIGILFVAIFILNIILAAHIIQVQKENELLKIHFLNVGQGDAALIELPGGASVLIDGGPSTKTLLQELSNALSPFDRSIDLISSSHPQQDHIGGLPEIFKRFKTSAYISNTDTNTIGAFKALQNTLREQHIPNLALTRGDKIKHKESIITVLYPTRVQDEDLNENSLVLLVESASTTALFTGDIGFKTEKHILLQLSKIGLPKIDILKVPHHGSKYSTSNNFIQAIQPKIAIIQVGKNRFGHPTKETLSRLKNAKTYRNDKDGTITLTSNGKKVDIKHTNP